MKKQINEDAKLEQYYAGDDIWYKFARTCKEEVERMKTDEDPQRIASLKEKLKNDEYLTYVIYYHLDSDSLDWVERQVPALNHLTPLECLESESLTLRLREALLRMP